MRGWLVVVCVAGCRGGFDFVVDARDRDGTSDDTVDSSVTAGCADRGAVTSPTWWVATTGSDANNGAQATPVATITRAIELARTTGGTIVVGAGSYTAEPGGEVYFDTTVPIRIYSEERYRAVVRRFNCESCTDLIIDGFEVTGATLPLVQVNGGVRVTVIDNVVHDGGSAGIRVTNAAAMVNIFDNLVYDSSSSAIHVNVGSDVVIRGNVIFDVTMMTDLSRIWLEDVMRTTVAGNVVFRVRDADNDYGLISFRQTATTTVENNVIAASPQSTSVFAPVGFNQASGAATVRHNTFVGPLPGSAFGIGVTSVMSGSTYTIVNNMWTSPGTTQAFTAGSAPANSITMRHNLYWNAPSGTFTPGGSPNPTNDAEALIADPGTMFTIPPEPTWSATTRQFGGGATTICDVRGQLVDAIAAIPATSPARSAADPSQQPSTDIRGRPRPSPAALGAYEP